MTLCTELETLYIYSSHEILVLANFRNHKDDGRQENIRKIIMNSIFYSHGKKMDKNEKRQENREKKSGSDRVSNRFSYISALTCLHLIVLRRPAADLISRFHRVRHEHRCRIHQSFRSL